MKVTAKGLSDERATRFLAALRGGMTSHLFGVNTKSLELYFATHPDYALEARPLIETNAATGADSESATGSGWRHMPKG
jgi:hypothetical protein